MPGSTSPIPLLSPDILSIETAADKAFVSDFTNLFGHVDWLGGFLSLGSATVTHRSLSRAFSSDTFAPFPDEGGCRPGRPLPAQYWPSRPIAMISKLSTVSADA